MLRNTKTKLLSLAVGLGIAPLAYLGLLQINGNFHSVANGDVYRSAQPSASDINQYSEMYGIRSIINLRGSNPDQAWYREEVYAANSAGIKHYDFRMSASRELTDKEIKKLVALMRLAPKPLLIHCKSGADRSGLAAALYLAEVRDAPLEKAEDQISFLYGHISIPYLSAAYPMDTTWERIEQEFKGI